MNRISKREVALPVDWMNFVGHCHDGKTERHKRTETVRKLTAAVYNANTASAVQLASSTSSAAVFKETFTVQSKQGKPLRRKYL